jgi:hypothetical protein
MTICCQVHFKRIFAGNGRNWPYLRRFFACPIGQTKAISSAAGSHTRSRQQHIVLCLQATLVFDSAHFSNLPVFFFRFRIVVAGLQARAFGFHLPPAPHPSISAAGLSSLLQLSPLNLFPSPV